MSATDYMRARLKLLAEGGALAGTPEQFIARHEQAYVDLLRLRAANERRPDNLDLVGG